ncbi:hypothetical protein EYF80_018564 [Liparis tanakae]|uniref:Uncharacterized protein n=1 Tax=Liparis tanakae TaxID=230148 RepID=A0A4Z2HZK1_9TELE|nr:hypothetical protein EYF80_018564 [Liparis tanakae]
MVCRPLPLLQLTLQNQIQAQNPQPRPQLSYHCCWKASPVVVQLRWEVWMSGCLGSAEDVETSR